MIELSEVGHISENWQELISHRPSEDLQRLAHNEGFYFQPIEGMAGYTVPQNEPQSEIFHVNLDFFPVRITLMPRINDERTSPETFLRLIRTSYFDGFLDARLAIFRKYNEQQDLRWRSVNPIGSVVSIDMLDDASVHCSLFENRRWIFSTIHSPRDGFHSVRGNREFGYYIENPSTVQSLLAAASTTVASARKSGYQDRAKHAFTTPSYVFYTKGADRIIDGISESLVDQYAYSETEKLWVSLQVNIVNFVKRNDGLATIEESYSARHRWLTIKQKLWRPAVPWVPLY